MESRYPCTDMSIRYNADVARYNEIAKKVVTKHGFAINDLYSVAEPLSDDYYSDMTHLYTPEGTKILTSAVIHAIGDALGCEFPEFTLTDYEEAKNIIGM